MISSVQRLNRIEFIIGVVDVILHIVTIHVANKLPIDQGKTIKFPCGFPDLWFLILRYIQQVLVLKAFGQ